MQSLHVEQVMIAYHKLPPLSNAATEMVVSVAMLEGQWGVMSLLL